MGALQRVKRDNADNIMLPVNVEGLIDNEGLTTKQGIVLFGLLGILLIDVLWFKDTRLGATFIGWFVNIAIWLFLAQFLIRKFVIDEDYKMAQVEQMDKFVRCAPAIMWDVMAVNDDTNVMQYSDGRVGVIIGIEQATIVGREPSFKDIHYDSISDFLRELNKGGLKWMHIDLMMNAKNDKRLTVLAETVNKCDIPAIKEKTTLHLGFLRGLEVRTLYEMEFYLVVANATTGAPKMLSIIEEALVYLDEAAYNQVATINRVGLNYLMAEMSVVDSFDADETMRQLAKKQQVIKQAFDIQTVEFRNTLSDDLLDNAIVKTNAVKRGETSTIIELDVTMRNKLINGADLLRKRGGTMHEGTVEESLIGNKVKIKNNSKAVEGLPEVEDTVEQIAPEKVTGFSIGDVDAVGDIDILSKTEEEEAKKAMAALGEEDAWNKAKQAELKARTAQEWKDEAARKDAEAKAAAEENQRRLDEIKKKREDEKAREVNVDDLLD